MRIHEKLHHAPLQPDPDQIRLVPAGELKFDAAPHEVREDLNSIPVGTKLYQVWTVRKEGRIVDGDGNRLPAYDDFLDALQRLGVTNARLPVCEGNVNGTLPTSCVM